MYKILWKLCLMIILFSFFSACNKEYNEETCQQLLFRSYKGSPQANNEMIKNCQGIKLKYSKKDCQKALEKLIISGQLSSIKRSYGEDIKKCFSENDIKNFSKE